MNSLRSVAGGLGNLMFQHAFVVIERQRRGLDGHFPHSAEYFEGHEEGIKRMFGGGIGHDDRVSIHVRRTDYLDEGRPQFALPLTYYRDALAYFPSDRFLIFSDDVAWCREHFRGDTFEFSDHVDAVDALNAMAACRHNIIANSSFSFWAAFLNPNPGRRVIAPSQWERGGWFPKLPSDWTFI